MHCLRKNWTGKKIGHLEECSVLLMQLPERNIMVSIVLV